MKKYKINDQFRALLKKIRTQEPKIGSIELSNLVNKKMNRRNSGALISKIENGKIFISDASVSVIAECLTELKGKDNEFKENILNDFMDVLKHPNIPLAVSKNFDNDISSILIDFDGSEHGNKLVEKIQKELKILGLSPEIFIEKLNQGIEKGKGFDDFEKNRVKIYSERLDPDFLTIFLEESRKATGNQLFNVFYWIYFLQTGQAEESCRKAIEITDELELFDTHYRDIMDEMRKEDPKYYKAMQSFSELLLDNEEDADFLFKMGSRTSQLSSKYSDNPEEWKSLKVNLIDNLSISDIQFISGTLGLGFARLHRVLPPARLKEFLNELNDLLNKYTPQRKK